MQLATDGTPIISTPQDQQKTDRFVDKLVARLYDRLPWVVKRFLSKEALASYIRSEIINMAGSV